MGQFGFISSVPDGGNFTMGAAVTDSKRARKLFLVILNPPQLDASMDRGLTPGPCRCGEKKLIGGLVVAV